MFILVYQVPKVTFYLKVKRWLQLSGCVMTRNTPTMVAWCLPALLAASIITCLPGIDNHLHRELLSLPANICRPYQFPMETNYVWREQCSDDCLLFLNPPVPRGVLRKSIRGMMPSNCLYKKWWCEQAGIS